MTREHSKRKGTRMWLPRLDVEANQRLLHAAEG